MSSSKGYIRQNYRLYPSKKQQEILNNYLGASRFVWNHFLDYEKLLYEETKKFDLSRSSLQKLLTVSREPTGKYYVSILCEVENLTPELVMEIKRAVGCDLGIKDLIITSDGEVFKNNKNLKRDERRLKIRQSHHIKREIFVNYTQRSDAPFTDIKTVVSV